MMSITGKYYQMIDELRKSLGNSSNAKHLYCYKTALYTEWLLVKNVTTGERTIIRFWSASNPIGWARIKKALQTYHTFKRYPIDRHIFAAPRFKDIAKRRVSAYPQIALLEYGDIAGEYHLYGSQNIDTALLEILLLHYQSMGTVIDYDYQGRLLRRSDSSTEVIQGSGSNMRAPRVFISYSWDNEQHKLWCLKLAADLIKSGVEAVIDEWDIENYNDDIAFFMEGALRNCDFVLIICTDEYARRSNNREGGVGTESTIITGDFYNSEEKNKYLPIARQYSKRIISCLPDYLKTKRAIDFSTDSKYNESMEMLLRRLFSKPKYERPKLGKQPTLVSRKL